MSESIVIVEDARDVLIAVDTVRTDAEVSESASMNGLVCSDCEDVVVDTTFVTTEAARESPSMSGLWIIFDMRP